MKKYEWNRASEFRPGTVFWIGRIDGEGWFMFCRDLQSENFEESEYIGLINEKGREDIRQKKWVRESFRKTKDMDPPPDIVSRMKGKLQILISRVEAQRGADMGRWPSMEEAAFGISGRRAYDPSSGMANTTTYYHDPLE